MPTVLPIEAAKADDHAVDDLFDRRRLPWSQLVGERAADTESRAAAACRRRAGVALAGVLAAQGEGTAARVQLERVLRRAYRDHHVAYGLGAAYAQLRDTDRAMHWLRIAADTGFPCLPWFERDPLLEPRRGRPEYSALLTYVRARRDSSLSAHDR
jgi:hypothetical protein